MSDDHERRLATVEANQAHMKESLDTLVEEVVKLRTALTRGRGFFAGVAAVVLPLWGIALSLVLGAWDKLTS